VRSEDDDLAPLRPPEIVSEPIHKKAIAAHDFQLKNIIALVENVPSSQCAMPLEIVWWKPNCVASLAHDQLLGFDQGQYRSRRLEPSEHAILSSDEMKIPDAARDAVEEADNCVRNCCVRIFPEILFGDAEECRLHRPGGNGHRLQK